VEQNIVFYAGWLGHYVADGANPLHTTVNYNGWVEANPKGFTTSRETHSNFENAFVNQHLPDLKFARLVQTPTRVEHPFRDYVAYLRKSQREVAPLYELEKAGAFKGRGTPAGVEFLREQFARGTQMLVNLWYTAWVDSAEPVAARQ
jgi:hypothetical protein